MDYCSFAVRITRADNRANSYEFQIVDTFIFELNVKYYTRDNCDVEMFFILDNEKYDIQIAGQFSRVFLKKRLLTLDYCSGFLATHSAFKIVSGDKSFCQMAAALPPNFLCDGDILFIRTNLLAKKKSWAAKNIDSNEPPERSDCVIL